jgi:hypothetical protein
LTDLFAVVDLGRGLDCGRQEVGDGRRHTILQITLY